MLFLLCLKNVDLLLVFHCKVHIAMNQSLIPSHKGQRKMVKINKIKNTSQAYTNLVSYVCVCIMGIGVVSVYTVYAAIVNIRDWYVVCIYI